MRLLINLLVNVIGQESAEMSGKRGWKEHRIRWFVDKLGCKESLRLQLRLEDDGNDHKNARSKSDQSHVATLRGTVGLCGSTLANVSDSIRKAAGNDGPFKMKK